jgi:hypothetical protein
MALQTLEKAPFGAISHRVFDDFLRFFGGLAHLGANWRACGPEKRWL